MTNEVVAGIDRIPCCAGESTTCGLRLTPSFRRRQGHGRASAIGELTDGGIDVRASGFGSLGGDSQGEEHASAHLRKTRKGGRVVGDQRGIEWFGRIHGCDVSRAKMKTSSTNAHMITTGFVYVIMCVHKVDSWTDKPVIMAKLNS